MRFGRRNRITSATTMYAKPASRRNEAIGEPVAFCASAGVNGVASNVVVRFEISNEVRSPATGG